jgi:hypothetical protein
MGAMTGVVAPLFLFRVQSGCISPALAEMHLFNSRGLNSYVCTGSVLAGISADEFPLASQHFRS